VINKLACFAASCINGQPKCVSVQRVSNSHCKIARTNHILAAIVIVTLVLKMQVASTPRGPERDLLLKRMRQNETAAHIDKWLRSPGLQPPQAIENLSK
jgi:hypothetical protein